MKLSTIAALLVLALAPRAQAQSASVTITVQPNVNKSLTVQLNNGATYFDLGNANPNSLISGATPYIVTNNGNIQESFVLQISSEADPNPGPGIAPPGFPWTGIDVFAASLTGLTDKFELYSEFASTATTPGSIPESDTFLVTHSGRLANGAQFAGSQTGLNVSAVPGTNARGLYLGLRSGSYTTTNSQKRIGITVAGQ